MQKPSYCWTAQHAGTHQCIVVFTRASERHFTVIFALDNAAVFHDKEESNCNKLQRGRFQKRSAADMGRTPADIPQRVLPWRMPGSVKAGSGSFRSGMRV